MHHTFEANGQRKVFLWNSRKRWKRMLFMDIPNSYSKINTKGKWWDTWYLFNAECTFHFDKVYPQISECNYDKQEVSSVSVKCSWRSLIRRSTIRLAPLFDENPIPLDNRIRERQLYLLVEFLFILHPVYFVQGRPWEYTFVLGFRL